jgi:hypothetical protein
LVQEIFAMTSGFTEDHQGRLHRVQRLQTRILSAVVLSGCAVGLAIGILEQSVEWGILAALLYGLLLFVGGSIVFVLSGGHRVIRRRRST